MIKPLENARHLPLPRHRSWSRTTRILFATFAISFAIGNPRAGAQAGSQTEISESTQRQIDAIRRDEESRTPAQRKVASALLHASRQAAAGVAIPEAPALRPNVQAQPDGRYEVKITADVTVEVLAAIGSLGGTVLESYPAYRVIYALLPLPKIETLAQRPGVQFIGLPPRVNIRRDARAETSADAASQPAAAETAINDPEGDATHGAKSARTQYGATGLGVKVGVISDTLNDSANSYQTALSNGYVSAVTVIPGQSGGVGSAEGLAMLEIVHRIAPGAQLFFATGFGTEQAMADSVRAMQADGCQIIIDDIGYADENPFQDDVVSQAVVDVTSKGVLFFSAGGNSGNLDAGASSCWEGDFKSAANGKFLDFNAGTGRPLLQKNLITAGAAIDIDLFWSEPENNVASQYDLYEFDGAGNVVQVSNDDVTQTGTPYQSLQVTPGDTVGVQLASGVARFLHVDTSGDGASFAVGTAGHARGHNALDAVNSFCVAATPAAVSGGNSPDGPYPNLFNSGDAVEDYSDDGPRRMFFKPDGTAYTPGNFTSTGGTVFAKPDFTAADGVTTSVPAIGGSTPFYGTSAAAPHAGALAALALSSKPALTPAQLTTALRNGTVQITTPGPGNRDAGAGILLAPKIFTALQGSGPVPTISSISPGTGPIGATIAIRGTNFAAPLSVIFAGNKPAVHGVSPTQLNVQVPGGAITGPIRVTTSAGSVVSTTNFVITGAGSAPTITGVSPGSGSVGSTVMITGTNFVAPLSIVFGGNVPAVHGFNATQINAQVPGGAVTGPIRVTTSNGSFTTSANFRVTP